MAVFPAHQGADGQKPLDAAGPRYRDGSTHGSLLDKKIKLESQTEGQNQDSQLNPVPEPPSNALIALLIHFPSVSPPPVFGPEPAKTTPFRLEFIYTHKYAEGN